MEDKCNSNIEKLVHEKYEIEHLGKKFSTIHFEKNFTDEQCEEIRNNFFNSCSKKEVLNQMKKLKNNGSNVSKAYYHYFYPVSAECILKDCKWSIKQFLESNDLIRFAIGKTRSFPKIYQSESDIENIKILFRLSPSGTAAKLSNYPYSSAKDIVMKYNKNGHYYDFSCGWGVRMLASLSSEVCYYGTDPNNKLVQKLNECGNDFMSLKSATLSFLDNKETKFDIKCHGSENFVAEWENKMGLCFSSPPYFDLEDYVNGENQSIKNFSNYDDWLNKYWRTTVKNCKKYLVENGNFLVNIKNIKNYNLFDDCLEICKQEGFKHIENIDLKNINRIFLKQNEKNTDELIMVLKNER